MDFFDYCLEAMGYNLYSDDFYYSSNYILEGLNLKDKGKALLSYIKKFFKFICNKIREAYRKVIDFITGKNRKNKGGKNLNEVLDEAIKEFENEIEELEKKEKENTSDKKENRDDEKEDTRDDEKEDTRDDEKEDTRDDEKEDEEEDKIDKRTYSKIYGAILKLMYDVKQHNGEITTREDRDKFINKCYDLENYIGGLVGEDTKVPAAIWIKINEIEKLVKISYKCNMKDEKEIPDLSNILNETNDTITYIKKAVDHALNNHTTGSGDIIYEDSRIKNILQNIDRYIDDLKNAEVKIYTVKGPKEITNYIKTFERQSEKIISMVSSLEADLLKMLQYYEDIIDEGRNKNPIKLLEAILSRVSSIAKYTIDRIKEYGTVSERHVLTKNKSSVNK